MEPLYVGIVGSRRRNTLHDRKIVLNLVEHIVSDRKQSVTIVSGGAKGVDSFAEEAARVLGVEFISIIVPSRPEVRGLWEFRIRAFARNKKIALVSDMVYALVSVDRKGGTENTISHASGLGRIVVIVNESGGTYLHKEEKERWRR